MNRNEVNKDQTWDLSHIFKSESEYLSNVELYKNKIKTFEQKYKGKISSFTDINESILDLIEIEEISAKIGAYASLPLSVDTFDDVSNKRLAELYAVFGKYGSRLSFYENELLTLDEALLLEASQKLENKTFIEEVLKTKKYALDTNVEEVLSKLQDTLGFPYKLYNTTKLKDINFGTFMANGIENEINYNLYEGELEYSSDTEIRRNSARKFYDTLRMYQHTTAAAYNAHVQKEKTLSEIRGHNSVIDYLLLRQNVERSLYDRQIDVIMEDLAPHMRKYASILKKVHGLDKITYFDLKMDVDPTYSPSVTFEEAKEYILKGLSVLGDDYLKLMNEAFDNRWIDYANNDGKSTGAFCSSPYGTTSFILMSFNEKMSDVMTLAHELGHAGHFQMAHKNQNILNSRSSMYFVEAPSTANELIVENYLLKIAEEKNDLRMKRWVLSQIVAKTYYHNFVTHLLEAHYQREVYNLVDRGEHVYANTLNDLFRKTLEKFWSDAVELEEGSELTWMRQPHYYMGLYPYTYSAGLTIGTQVAKNISEKGREEADKWIEVLKMGGSKSPLDLAKSAGVDVSTDAPLKETIKYIGSLVDEIERITLELEK